MAALVVTGSAETVSLTAATAKTVAQIVAPAQQALILHEWSVSVQGTNPSAKPGKVQLKRQTTAGTMTALTLYKWDTGRGETIQTTAQHTATVEPTSTDLIMSENVHPQFGYTWPGSQRRVIIIPGGTRLGFILTFTDAVDVTVRFAIEE